MTELRTATVADHATAGAVLADAFDADPMFQWVFPDPLSRPRLLEAMFGFLAEHQYLALGESVMAEDAVALWQPPGSPADDDFWVEHGEEFAVALEGRMERLGALGVAMGEHHPTDDHWYLLAIGVRPGAQGRGLGGELLAHTLAKVDAAGQPAYLEASSRRSRVLYERHGFEVTGELTVEDSPPMWPMWRQPRPGT
jgi:GNAT superfamily N-acetyltransferase